MVTRNRDRWRLASGDEKRPLPLQGGSSAPSDVQAGRIGRILVVEDDYFVALTNEAALTDAGFEVLAIATTGEEAVEVALRERPDLVLMDIRLAGPMDGIEAAVKLAEYGVASLFTSAHSDDNSRRRGAKANPAGWLTKPFSAWELVTAVEAALTRSH